MQKALTVHQDAEKSLFSFLASLTSFCGEIDTAPFEGFKQDKIFRRLQMVALHADSILQSRKKQLQNMIADLAVIENELPNAIKANKDSKSLRTDINQATSTINKMKAEIAQMQSYIPGLTDVADKALLIYNNKKTEHQNLLWLANTLEPFQKTCQSHRNLKSDIVKRQKEISELQSAIAQRRKTQDAQDTQLQKSVKTVETLEQREIMIADLLKRLPEIEVLNREHASLEDRNHFLTAKHSKYQNLLITAQTSEKAAIKHMQQAQAAYDNISQAHDARSQLLAKLIQLVDAPLCPLCGHEFASLRAAKQQMQTQIASIPSELKQLAEMCETTKQSLTQATQHRTTVQEQLRNIEKDILEFQEKKKDGHRHHS